MNEIPEFEIQMEQGEEIVFDWTDTEGETEEIKVNGNYQRGFENLCEAVDFALSLQQAGKEQGFDIGLEWLDENQQLNREQVDELLKTSCDSVNRYQDLVDFYKENLTMELNLDLYHEGLLEEADESEDEDGLPPLVITFLRRPEFGPKPSEVPELIRMVDHTDWNDLNEIADLVDRLQEQGYEDDEINDALNEAYRNAPAPERPSPHAKEEIPVSNQLLTGDPVSIFSGQLMLNEQDVYISTPGNSLSFDRMYLSGEAYFGPFGFNWDHPFNQSVRVLGNGVVAVWNGQLREEHYTPDEQGGYKPQTGIHNQLIQEEQPFGQAPAWVLNSPDGTRRVFAQPSGWPNPLQYPLIRVEGRYGFCKHLTYNEKGQLVRISHEDSHHLNLVYNDCGLIQTLEDHIGRIWTYHYDQDVEHLIGVTTPATDQAPEGFTTCFEYDKYKYHQSLQHNITRITGPDGQVFLENEYEADFSSPDFGRLVCQRYGSHFMTLKTNSVQFVPGHPDLIHVPFRKVEVQDNDGKRTLVFNYRGNPLQKRTRLTKDKSFRVVIEQYRYDAEGNEIEYRGPDGAGYRKRYDIEHPGPRARGNLLDHRKVSMNLERPIQKITYDPQFFQPLTIEDENGAVTTFVLDYEEGTGQKGLPVKMILPPVTLEDGSTQTATIHFYYNARGQLIQEMTPEGRSQYREYYESGIQTGMLKSILAEGETGLVEVHKLEYDAVGNLIAEEDGVGGRKEYKFDELDQLQEVTLPKVNGKLDKIRYEYTSTGKIAAVHSPAGSYKEIGLGGQPLTTLFEYDVMGNLCKEIMWANTAAPLTSTYCYDHKGRLIQEKDHFGRETVYRYDERGLPLKVETRKGKEILHSMEHVYNRNATLMKKRDWTGKEEKYAYDPWKRFKTVTLPTEASETPTLVHYTHGPLDRVESIQMVGVATPGGAPVLLSEETYTYNERNRILSIGKGGLQCHMKWDKDHFLIEKKDPYGIVEYFSYNQSGRMASRQDAEGNREEYAYDGMGNLIQIIEVEKLENGEERTQTRQFEYDARSRMVRSTDPNGKVTQYSYDSRDLLTKETFPEGDFRRYEYNLQGLPTRTFFEEPGQSLSLVHQWQRNPEGSILRYTDPKGNTTRYSYDGFGALKTMEFPDGRTFQHEYDAFHRLKSIMDPNGSIREYQYDSTGRISRISSIPASGVAGVPEIRMGYDGLGRVVRQQLGADVYENHYDLQGRITQTMRNGKGVSYGFVSPTGISTLTFPDGRKDRYERDELGRLSRIELLQKGTANLTGPQLTSGTELASFTYSAEENRQDRTTFNQTNTRFQFDPLGKLVGLHHTGPQGNTLHGEQFVYGEKDHLRLIKSEMPTPNSRLMGYDSLGRMSHSISRVEVGTIPELSTPEAAEAFIATIPLHDLFPYTEYNWDKGDNWTKTILSTPESPGPIMTDFTTNALNQMTQIFKQGGSNPGTFDFQYDDNGNLVQDAKFTYTYNVFNQLVAVKNLQTGEQVLTQSYDPMGRVVKRKLGNQPERTFHYDGEQVIQEDENGIPVVQYTAGRGLDDYVSLHNGQDYVLHQDRMGSRVAVTDDTGAPVVQFKYDDYGIPQALDGTGTQQILTSQAPFSPVFAGYPYLSEAELYHARARSYQPEWGRFLQRDPKGYSDSPNPYLYVGGSPYEYTDPLGKDRNPLGLKPQIDPNAWPNARLRDQYTYAPSPARTDRTNDRYRNKDGEEAGPYVLEEIRENVILESYLNPNALGNPNGGPLTIHKYESRVIGYYHRYFMGIYIFDLDGNKVDDIYTGETPINSVAMPWEYIGPRSVYELGKAAIKQGGRVISGITARSSSGRMSAAIKELQKKGIKPRRNVGKDGFTPNEKGAMGEARVNTLNGQPTLPEMELPVIPSGTGTAAFRRLDAPILQPRTILGQKFKGEYVQVKNVANLNRDALDQIIDTTLALPEGYVTGLYLKRGTRLQWATRKPDIRLKLDFIQEQRDIGNIIVYLF